MGKRGFTRKLMVLAGIAGLVLACGQNAGSPASPAGKANFGPSSSVTVRLDGPWTTFDPTTPNLPTDNIVAALYDRLVYTTPDNKIVPYLASSWSQSGSVIKFTLVKGVTCSDGTPLTATLVANSFDRLLGVSNPKTKSGNVPGEFGPGPFTVTADDAAGIFTLNLGTTWGSALQSIAGGDAYVICPKGLAAGALNDAAYGSGPYTIASEDRATQITLKLRSDWTWGPIGRTAKDMPGQLIYRIVSSDSTAANLLLTGGIDIARVQGVDIKRLLAEKSLGRLKATPWYTNGMWLNPTAGHVTADPAVREAIFTAISADGWVASALGGEGTATTSLFATSAPCFNPATAQYIPKTDLTKAKQILLAAGYTADSSGKLSKNGQPLTILVVGEMAQASGPEYVQSQLTQVGFTVNLFNGDHVTYSTSYLQPGKFDIIVPGIASNTLGTFVVNQSGPPPPVGRNFSRIQDPALDQLIQKALQESGTQACTDWGAVQIAWLKNHYIRPLGAQNFWWFSKNPNWTYYATTSIFQPESVA